MKQVLITGSGGFIGKSLAQKLKELNYKVFTLDRHEKENILEPQTLSKFKTIDTVFHLAAVVGYKKVQENIYLAYRTNVLGTINVLNFCLWQKAKLIFPSTFIYGPPFKRPKKETDSIQPTNFYTHTKYLAELFCQLYAKKYQLDVVIARTSNAYGPNQPKQYIIPVILDNLKKNKEIELTHPSAGRDFIYITDLVGAWIKLAQVKTHPGEIFNVSSGKSVTLKELVTLIQYLTGTKIKVRFTKKLRKNEVFQSLMDNSKIIQKIGWKPKISLNKGLKTILAISKKKFYKEEV